jgi:L-threonylcarbamoyladenylate synthase
MRTVRTQRLDADDAGIARAAALLRAGRLVAFGTETVYGLGADAAQPQAIEAVFAAKGRPRHNPLIGHVADSDAAFRQVRETPLARLLADAFWPGPLTLVLPARADSTVCAAAAAGLATLAVRVPSGTVAQGLLRALDRPVAAPSANPSGRVSPSEAAHVLEGLAGRIDAVLDCGPCAVGLESTVLELSGGQATLLRPGGIAAEAIEALLAARGVPALRLPAPGAYAAPASPGMLASHYAPTLPLRLDAAGAGPDEALLAFGPASPGAGLTWNLSPDGDLAQAASRLFAGLRWLDTHGLRLGLLRIAVMPIPSRGLGLAMRDRLRRAAAPRAPFPGTPFPGTPVLKRIGA